MGEQSLEKMTTLLLANTDAALARFEKSKSEGKRGDFHQEVKPFADEVKHTAALWKTEAARWVAETKPKNFHLSQVETAADYLEVISVQAFFPETSKKRFLDQIQTVQFTLNGMLRLMEEDCE